MDIRIATPGDARRIASMAIAFRNHLERAVPTEAQFHESVGRLLEAPDAEFYIAESGAGPVGYVLQRFRYSMWAAGQEAAIEDLFVLPEIRKGGVGGSLIRFALQRAKDRSCASVCLDTNENNAASTRIYTQLGFCAFSKRWNGRQVFFRLNLDT